MRKFLVIWLSVLIALGWVIHTALGELPDGHLHLHFLDVGQGDGYLIVMPDGKRVLVDAGPGSAVITPLRRAIGWMSDDIDIVLLTHFDRDHAEGMLAVLSNFRVKQLLITGVDQKTELQRMVFEQATADNIPISIVSADTDFWLNDHVFMDILWPFEPLAGRYFEKANEVGIVFRLMYANGVDSTSGVRGETQRCILLGMADTGFQTEDALFARDRGALDCNILKVGHHGSKYSSGADFLRAVSPELSVISVGAKNGYHHPTGEVLGRLRAVGTKILRTDQMGTVEMIVDPESGEMLHAFVGR